MSYGDDLSATRRASDSVRGPADREQDARPRIPPRYVADPSPRDPSGRAPYRGNPYDGRDGGDDVGPRAGGYGPRGRDRAPAPSWDEPRRPNGRGERAPFGPAPLLDQHRGGTVRDAERYGGRRGPGPGPAPVDHRDHRRFPEEASTTYVPLIERVDVAGRPSSTGRRASVTGNDLRHPTPSPRPAPRRPQLRSHNVTPRRGLGPFFRRSLLGLLVPGAGLIASGRRISGGLLLGLCVTTLLVSFGVLWVSGRPLTAAATVLGNPLYLYIAVATHLLIVLLWCASLVRTGSLNRPLPRTRGKGAVARATTTLLCLVVAAPTVWGAFAAGVGLDTLRGISAGIMTTGSAKRPDAGQADAWAQIPRVNVLLVGADGYPHRPGLRSDSIMVASIDTRSGDMTLIGIPRNLQGYQLRPSSPLYPYYPQGRPACGLECMINAVWRRAEDHRAEYPPDQQEHVGSVALAEVVGDLVGLTIDNVLVIDIRGFSGLVDAVGGVDVTVRERLPIGGHTGPDGRPVVSSIKGWIEPGRQHLDGYRAMWYARSRVLSDDYARMRRQRCVVGALVRQVNPATIVTDYQAIMKVVATHVKTDIPLSPTAAEGLPAWLQLAERVRSGHLRSLPLTERNIAVDHPDPTAIQALVQHALTAPSTAPSASAPSTAGASRRASVGPSGGGLERPGPGASRGASGGNPAESNPSATPSAPSDRVESVDASC